MSEENVKVFQIKIDKTKPNLHKAMTESPALVKEVISAFVSLMEESFEPTKGVRWVDLPKQFSNRLDFLSLIRGVLRGALDTKAINPEAFEVLGIDIHPLALLHPQPDVVDSDVTEYTHWRRHFMLPEGTNIDEDMIIEVIRKLLRHARWVKVEQLQKAIESNTMASYRGLGDVALERLPFTPALRYQREKFGELAVGKMFSEVGSFDCGKLPVGVGEPHTCPACRTAELVDAEQYLICPACNAGFTV